MNDYLITCTSTCDLTKQILNDRDIKYVHFKMILDNTTYLDDFFNDYPYEQFYEDVKYGKMPTTSQVGFGVYEEFFENLIKINKSIMHICLSSGLSSDYLTAKAVAEELNKKNNCHICVIDSLAASSGYGMLVLMADDNKRNGMSFEENIQYLENIKLNIHHWFISTDLSSYIRGGRISKTSGFFGAALKICPLMNMNVTGTLQPLEKIRTKSKALESQLNKMVNYANNGLEYDGEVFISCSMCEEDAEILKNMILDKFKKIKDVSIFKIGLTIGAHTGQGTVALFFKGGKR